MSQHDFILSDAPGLAMRADMELAVQALASMNSGLVAPLTVAGENDAYTKVMLHLNSDFVDSAVGTTAPHAWTVAGNTQISAAQSVFVGKSAFFDGSGDYLSTPDHADFTLGSGDFTIDFWFNITAANGVGTNLCGQWDPAVDTGANCAWRMFRLASDNKIWFQRDGVTVLGSGITFTTANPGWHHMAIVRSGSTLSMYTDGVLRSTYNQGAAAITDSASLLIVGGYRTSATFTGYMQEFRLSIGIARWTADFTPPNSPYGGSAPYAGMLWLDTTVLPDGQLRMRNQANTAWINIAGFPLKATPAEVVAGTDDTKYVTPFGYSTQDVAVPFGARNRIVNPAMQISQQNGNTAGTANGYFAADQWQYIMAAAGAAVSFARVASVTPNGSLYRLRLSVTTALASLAGGDYCAFTTVVEGLRTADFGFGAAGAKQIILRFGFRAPAGTYAAVLRGPSPYPVYNMTITITAGQANTDTVQTFVIPGNPAGAWPTTNVRAMELYITVAAGASHFAPPNVWAVGGAIGVTGQSNGLASTSNIFELFDVALYLDADATGIPPLWELPDEFAELLTCQRYFVAGVVTTIHTSVISGGGYLGMSYLPVDMRVNPTLVSSVNDTMTSFPATSVMTIPNTKTVYESRTANATGAGYYMSTSMFSARL